MLRPLAVLPLQLACQFLITGNTVTPNIDLAANAPVPKTAVELPDGYAVFREAGVAYKYHKNLMQWDQARKVCVADGGNLAVIDSFKKVQYIQTIKEAGAYPYVGIHRLYEITEWTDVRTGMPKTWLPWRSVTWDTDLGRKCTALWFDESGLYATACTVVLPFVCEVSLFKD